MSELHRTPAREPTWCRFVCPFCKADLEDRTGERRCVSCGTTFGVVDGVIDFRRQYPEGVVAPPGWKAWVDGQIEYERWATSGCQVEQDCEDQRGLAEVYSTLLPMRGRVLDVAGGFGLLRDLLSTDDQYVAIDPWIGAPRFLASAQPAISQRFRRVDTPVPFVAGHGEWLPFASRTFDWVHMRSCLDHFLDPFQAAREGWRVLVPGGHLAIGVAARGGPSSVMEDGVRGIVARVARKLRQEGLRGAAKRAVQRLRAPLEHDAHMWHPSLEAIQALLVAAGFVVSEWKWLEPPGDFCLYLRAQKPVTS
jgi:SAM-dependent methyltransferase